MANEAVAVAKERRGDDGDGVTTLSTGVRARIMPVAASLIDEVTARIREPEVPLWHNPDKDRDEPNPTDPAYLRALEDVARQRGVAAMDAMVMFGVELVDELPEDEGWIKRLRYLEKRGHLDLSEFDLDDPMDREYLYKRFVAVGNADLIALGERSGIRGEDVDRAAASFRGDGSGPTD